MGAVQQMNIGEKSWQKDSCHSHAHTALILIITKAHIFHVSVEVHWIFSVCNVMRKESFLVVVDILREVYESTQL